MPLSQRYVPHMIALLLLAVVPVALYSYARVRSDECAEPLVLVSGASVFTSPKRTRSMQARFAAAQFREGRLPGEDGEPTLSFAVIRSYDAKRLYYRLANRMLNAAPDRVELEWLEGDPRLPIRRASYKPDPASRMVTESAYLLVYDGEPVENPYRSQLLAAPWRLLTGNRPMTAFFVVATLPEAEAEAVRQRQADWLRGSWQRYRTICFP